MNAENENQKPVEQNRGGKANSGAGLENPSRAELSINPIDNSGKSPDIQPREHSISIDNPPELEISPALAAKAISELDKQVAATKTLVLGDGVTKEVPDYPTRQKAIELVLAYRLGRPIERQVKLTGGFQSHNDKVAALCATPEGLRMAIAVGLVQEEQPNPKGGRPRLPDALKSEKKPKVLNVSEFRSLNKPENDQKPVSQDCDKPKLF